MKKYETVEHPSDIGIMAFGKSQKEAFDSDSLFNPFTDTRILAGDPNENIKSMIVGIDVEGSELLVVDRLRQKGTHIDLVVSHHPEGKAFANFYEVMDLQIDIFAKAGISLSTSENLLSERKYQVARRVHSANHQRSIDLARLLNMNFLCMHTPCDNLAYQYLRGIFDKEKPSTLGKVVDILLSLWMSYEKCILIAQKIVLMIQKQLQTRLILEHNSILLLEIL